MATMKYLCSYCSQTFSGPGQSCQSLASAETCPNGNGYLFEKGDVIKTPGHYTKWTIEPKDFIMANKLDFPTGNVIKYVMRHATKNGREDLEKAKEYLDWLIQEHYPDE